jgi:hypothetical protein
MAGDGCLICFDEFSDENPAVTENHIGCGCYFAVHEDCWDIWNIDECIICHKEVIVEDEIEQMPQVLVVHGPVVIQRHYEPSILQAILIVFVAYCVFFFMTYITR